MHGLTLNELIQWQPPNQTFIIDHGILLPQTRLLIYGKEGSWKSMLSIQIAYAIANGTGWFGYHTYKTPVYILQTEIPQALLRKRVLKYCTGNHVTSDNVWFATEPYIKLDKGFGVAELEKELDRTHARVLITDPLFRTMAGRMTDEYDVRQYIDKLELLIAKYKLAIIIITHDRKHQIFEGMKVSMGTEDILGSRVLSAWLDTCILTELTPIDGEIKLTFEKVRHNEDEILKPMTLQVNRGNLVFTRKE